MRIGISCYSTFGGSGVVATEVGKALAARGHEVHLLSPSLPPRLQGFEDHVWFHEVTAASYPLFESSNPFSIALASRMADVADKHGLEVMHAHYAIPHASAALLARMALDNRLKVVTTLHGTDITVVGSDPSYLPMVRLAIRASDAVTSVSQYLKDETLRTFQVDRPIDVIPNFITPPEEVRHDCRSWLAPCKSAILTHISNFRPVKRVLDVVKVFERVRRDFPCRLVMVGDGPDRPEAEAYAREKGFADEVRFTGKLLNIGSVLACSDVFLLPSATESFGLAALEAMAYCVPVVASRVGGIPEVIRHGQDGFLEPLGDTEAMAADVLTLLRDPALRQRLGASARTRALDTFAEGPIIDQYEALYERILAKPKTTVDIGANPR